MTLGGLAPGCRHSDRWTGSSLHSLSLLPSPEVFMGFVKSYIQLFAYGSVTSEQWKQHLFTYFKDKVRRCSCIASGPPCRARSSRNLCRCCLGGRAEQGGLERLDVHPWDAASQTSVSGGAPFWSSLDVLHATRSQCFSFFVCFF